MPERCGDRAALDVLVAELTPLVWHVARGRGLDRGTAEDVVQTVWLALLRHLDRLAEPRALVRWLIITTRQEVARTWRPRPVQIRRSVEVVDRPGGDPLPDDEIPRAERDRHLWLAFNRLSSRCQELLRMTALAGRAEYHVVAEALRMPHGSIGPTRGRCLTALRTFYEGEVAEEARASSDLSALEFLLNEEIPQITLPADRAPKSADLTFPVSIYLDDESGHENVEEAVEVLLRMAGVDVVERDDPILGSWFRRMRARMRDAARSPIAREAAAVAAHALDSRGVLAHDANVTATLMQNLGPLLTSLQPTKDAVIRVGALLIVKVEWVVAVHQLTSVQQLRLDHQPHLLTSPRDILHALDLAPGPATPATNPTNGKGVSSILPCDEHGCLYRANEPLRMVERPDGTNA